MYNIIVYISIILQIVYWRSIHIDIVAILYDNFNGYYHGQEVHSNVLFYIHSVII